MAAQGNPDSQANRDRRQGCVGVAREENGEATELLQFCCKELGNQGRRKANLAKRIERGREEIRTK